MFAMFVFGWPNFFFICFVIGFVMTVIGLLSGTFHLHLPHIGHVHVPHVHVPHAHVPAAGTHGGGGAGKGSTVSPLNFATVMAFLTWFGGVGYLMTSVYRLWLLAALVFATLAGLIGASIVFWFFVKVMLTHDHSMDPDDFRIVGVVGTITNSIREGGTGELVYVQGGSRKTAAARAENGAAIARGTEVAVLRYEKGIAYVRPWQELDEHAGSTTAGMN